MKAYQRPPNLQPHLVLQQVEEEAASEANAKKLIASKKTAASSEVQLVKVPGVEAYGANVPQRSKPITDIDQLTNLSSEELHALFAAGRTPNPEHFKGEMRGVALAAPHHDDTHLGRLVTWVMTKIPPWKGKNALASPEGKEQGQGLNRILGRLLSPFEWNVVDTSFSKELSGGGGKVIRLDYASPDSLLNRVTGVRSVHDELREVGPEGSGVYLGLAGLVDADPVWTRVYNGLLSIAGRDERVSKDAPPVPVIYFALQAN